MAAPLDQRPTRGHHVRAHLYEAGVTRVGEDAAANMPEHVVRRHGAKRIGNLVAATVLTVAAIGGIGYEFGRAVDQTIDQYTPSGPQGEQPSGADHGQPRAAVSHGEPAPHGK